MEKAHTFFNAAVRADWNNSAGQDQNKEAYLPPAIEIIQVNVEQGFAVSPTPGAPSVPGFGGDSW